MIIKHLVAAFVVMVLGASMPLQGVAQNEAEIIEGKEGDDLVAVQSDNARMSDAIKEARSTLGVFWKLHAAYPDYAGAFSIKAGLATNNGNPEHIWIYDLSRDGDTVSGKLMNQPYDMVGDYQKDDPITFESARVSDWVIWVDGKRYGAYTMRVIADLLGGEEGAALMAEIHEDPIPPFAE